MIEFTVPAVPVPQPRQRTRAFQAGERIATQNYTPTKHPVNAFKAAVQQAFAAVYSGPPLEGPLHMTLLVLNPRPEAMNRKRGINGRKPDTRAKGDADNLTKVVFDALNKLAYHDDRQVSRVSFRKRVAAAWEQPHVDVVIEIDQGESDEVGSDQGGVIAGVGTCSGDCTPSDSVSDPAESASGGRRRLSLFDGPGQ